MTYMGKESKKTVDICMTDSLCCILETNANLQINCTSIIIRKRHGQLNAMCILDIEKLLSELALLELLLAQSAKFNTI